MKEIKLLLIISILFSPLLVAAQQDSIANLSVYKVNHKIEFPLAVLGHGLAFYGYDQLAGVASLSETQVLSLSPQDVNLFDRPALNFSQNGYERAHKASDLAMNLTVASSVLLFLDKEIRKDWKDIITLYLQAHLAGSVTYQAAAFPVRRPRPLAYNTNLSLAERSGSNTSNSFFSGHTSTTAIASFFMAKVYNDYHQLSPRQKILTYGVASLPPIFVGYYRIKAGKHFTSDVITGFAVGALTGILVPELHKRNKTRLSFLPIYESGIKGIALTYSFK
ncbi:MAG: phosphatase PAP2 family protein [Bacteroidetes bacterium]|nr:MAG: phosphatase PAP2 family protein [Bacteroidota bacterium]